MSLIEDFRRHLNVNPCSIVSNAVFVQGDIFVNMRPVTLRTDEGDKYKASLLEEVKMLFPSGTKLISGTIKFYRGGVGFTYRRSCGGDFGYLSVPESRLVHIGL